MRLVDLMHGGRPNVTEQMPCESTASRDAGLVTASSRSQFFQNFRMKFGDLDERLRRARRLPPALFPVLQRANGPTHQRGKRCLRESRAESGLDDAGHFGCMSSKVNCSAVHHLGPPEIGAYTHGMRSVADDLRDELQEEVLRLSFEERIALALRLGERGLEMFRQANGLDRETALREFQLQRQRQAGRTPSKCMSELIG